MNDWIPKDPGGPVAASWIAADYDGTLRDRQLVDLPGEVPNVIVFAQNPSGFRDAGVCVILSFLILVSSRCISVL